MEQSTSLVAIWLLMLDRAEWKSGISGAILELLGVSIVNLSFSESYLTVTVSFDLSSSVYAKKAGGGDGSRRKLSAIESWIVSKCKNLAMCLFSIWYFNSFHNPASPLLEPIMIPQSILQMNENYSLHQKRSHILSQWLKGIAESHHMTQMPSVSQAISERFS